MGTAGKYEKVAIFIEGRVAVAVPAGAAVDGLAVTASADVASGLEPLTGMQSGELRGGVGGKPTFAAIPGALPEDLGAASVGAMTRGFLLMLSAKSRLIRRRWTVARRSRRAEDNGDGPVSRSRMMF